MTRQLLSLKRRELHVRGLTGWKAAGFRGSSDRVGDGIGMRSALAVLPLLLTGPLGLQSARNFSPAVPRSETAGCPVTAVALRPPPVRTAHLVSGGWYGREGLWAKLPLEGIAAYPDALILPSGWIQLKLVWWRGERARGRLSVEGRALLGRSATLRSVIPRGSGLQGIQPTALQFSRPGCWRVTGRSGAASITFVLDVRKT
jgi:hypothetical protein